MRPLNITLLQKTKSVTISKTHIFLIANNGYTEMITIEKGLEQRKSVPLI